MSRAQSKIMTPSDKKASINEAREDAAECIAALKSTKLINKEAVKAVTAATKEAKRTVRAVAAQQKKVDRAKKKLAVLRAA